MDERVNPDLGDQPNVHTATLQVICGDRQYRWADAPVNVVLADGTIIENVGTMGTGTTAFNVVGDLAALPRAARIDQLDESGEGTLVEDRRMAIQSTIASHNARTGVTVRPRAIQPGSGFCGAADGGASAGAFALLLAAGLAARRRGRARWSTELLPACVPGGPSSPPVTGLPPGVARPALMCVTASYPSRPCHMRAPPARARRHATCSTASSTS